MKGTFVRAFATAGALAVALVVGYSVQPAGAAPALAPDCVSGQSQSAPPPHTTLAHGHLVAM